MTLQDLARQWLTSDKFTSIEELKTKFLKEFSSFGKTPHEWLRAWINLKFNHETDNNDEYIQKFTDLANLLNYPDDQQVQVFKMVYARSS